MQIGDFIIVKKTGDSGVIISTGDVYSVLLESGRRITFMPNEIKRKEITIREAADRLAQVGRYGFSPHDIDYTKLKWAMRSQLRDGTRIVDAEN